MNSGMGQLSSSCFTDSFSSSWNSVFCTICAHNSHLSTNFTVFVGVERKHKPSLTLDQHLFAPSPKAAGCCGLSGHILNDLQGPRIPFCGNNEPTVLSNISTNIITIIIVDTCTHISHSASHIATLHMSSQ